MDYNKQKKIIKFLSIILVIMILFKAFDFFASEITDKWAYEDAKRDDSAWKIAYEKILADETLTDNDYYVIFIQSGLGKPAVDALITQGRESEIEAYRDYYLKDKDYQCVRQYTFACHEAITDAEGNKIINPDFANLQNGDIIITLSIHSLGWRHGHAAVVVDAETGKTAQAVMIGEKSDFGTTSEWNEFPLVAVLRVKNIDEKTQNDVAQFVSENMIGINYALSAGIFGGKNMESIPFTTQCAHYVWYAYKYLGIDLDSNGGMVTPKELLHSDELEIVQVYGNITDL